MGAMAGWDFQKEKSVAGVQKLPIAGQPVGTHVAVPRTPC
jgi:hypothetical protein